MAKAKIRRLTKECDQLVDAMSDYNAIVRERNELEREVERLQPVPCMECESDGDCDVQRSLDDERPGPEWGCTLGERGGNHD